MLSISNDSEDKIYKFSSQYLLAMFRDVLNDYKDLKNKRLKHLYTYDLLQSSYSLEIIEAKIELLIEILNLPPWLEIQKNHNSPKNTDFRIDANQAYVLLQSLLKRREKIKEKYVSVKITIEIEQLKLEDYQCITKINLLSYILDIRSYDISLNKFN